MKHSFLIRLGGLVAIIGSVVFALVLLLSPWLAHVAHRAFGLVGFAEAVILPTFFLLLVVVIVAIAAIATLLRRTRYSMLAGLASAGSFVGLAFIFLGLLLSQDFVGLVPMFFGIVVLIVALGALAILSIVTNVLRWWGSVALVAGPLLLLFSVLPFGFSSHWLIGVPWMLVGYAVFRAATRQTGRHSRLQVKE